MRPRKIQCKRYAKADDSVDIIEREGEVLHVETVPLRAEGKTAILARVAFDVGQSCVFAFRDDRKSEALYHWAGQRRLL